MRSKNTTFMIGVSFLTLALLYGENPKQLWHGHVERREGRTVMINPEEPIYRNGVSVLKEELSIGGAEEARPDYIFGSPKDIAVDSSGNIYLLDLKPLSIKMFDGSGKFIRMIGRVGQGPGEFRMPWCLTPLPKTGVCVLDYLQRKLLYYGSEGNFEKEVDIGKHAGACSEFAISSSGDIIAKSILTGGGSELSRIELETGKKILIARQERKTIPLLTELSPTIVWALANNDLILWGISDTYQINVSDTHGELIRMILKASRSLTIKKEEFAEQIKAKFGGKPIPPGFEQDLPKYFPKIRKIIIDDDGTVLVPTYEKSERGVAETDVFDSQGRCIVKMAISSSFQAWKDGRLYAVQNDDNGCPVIKRYKVNFRY